MANQHGTFQKGFIQILLDFLHSSHAIYHRKFDKNECQFFTLLKGEGSPPTLFILVRRHICAILCLGTLQQRCR